MEVWDTSLAYKLQNIVWFLNQSVIHCLLRLFQLTYLNNLLKITELWEFRVTEQSLIIPRPSIHQRLSETVKIIVNQ